MSKLINVKTIASPGSISGSTTGVSGGIIYQTFGEFEKVNMVMAEWDANAPVLLSSVYTMGISGYAAYMKPSIISGNTVQLALTKSNVFISGVLSTGSGFIAMVSADLVSTNITILAYGE